MDEAFRKIAERGLISVGNTYRFAEKFKALQEGGDVTIGFLGGSITQGSLSSTPEKCYAYNVYSYFRESFKKSNIKYINAGIGATTSQFGVARVDSDLLAYRPDIVILEFSVNDTDNDDFKETFEGCVRKILSSEKSPALLMFNNVCYDTGVNAQRVHNEVGNYYSLPICSMKPSIYKELTDGRLKAPDFTPDNLHPNDFGHRMVADVIINLVEEIQKKIQRGESEKEYVLPEKTLTPNSFYASKRYNSRNVNFEYAGKFGDKVSGITEEEAEKLSPKEHTPGSVNVRLSGFSIDASEQNGITDVFKNGFRAIKKGAYIVFEAECRFISVQFRKTIHKPAPVALAVVDNDEEHAVKLDANFDETWGDLICLTDIAKNLPYGKHTLRIRLTDVPENAASDFYLVSVIVA